MRRQYLLSLSAGLAALALATPAVAQSEEDTPFDGFYVGGTIGFDAQPSDFGSTTLFDRNLDGNFNDTVLTGGGANAFSPGFCNGRGVSANAPQQTAPANPAAPVGSPCVNDKDDISYSARIGFDKQFGSIVVGIVGEFGKSEISDSTTSFSVTPANYVFTREIDYAASARARLGFAANTTLFYGTGGVAYAKLDQRFSSSQSTNTFTPMREKTDAWGYVAGGGIEQKLGRNFSLGLEYLYTQYTDDEYTVRIAGGPPAPAVTPFTNPGNGGNAAGTDIIRSDEKFRSHSVRATAAFRF